VRDTKRDILGIGGLEAQILDVVWEREDRDLAPTTVRNVYETLLTRRKIAYTTCMTVMVNLVKKRLLARDTTETTYTYTTVRGRGEVGTKALDAVLEQLLGGAVTYVKDWLEDLDTEVCEGCQVELVTEAMEHDVDNVPLCPVCMAELIDSTTLEDHQ
jgi:predicted transcriptional regulator